MIRFVFKSSKVLDCPAATKDLKLNTKNRDAAIQAEHIQYGPLNVDEPGQYWIDIADYWNTTEKAAQKSLCGNCVAFDISPRMKDCMPGETSDDDGELGYCWMHHFKCHSARSCRTWAKGGPITEDDKSTEWQKKNEGSLEEKKNDKMSPDEAIAKEGGALGFSKWEELTGMSREELEKYVKDSDHIKIHKHGDIIDTRSLKEEEEGGDEICPAGKAWAKDNYEKWPSAYASMGASKKCKELGHKKDESLQEDELDECWSTHERVPGTEKGAKGSCRLKTNESEALEEKKKKKQQKGKKRAAKVANRKSKKKKGALAKWRDEEWVQSDGTPCGDDEAQKSPKRCKPKSKYATMSKGEKKADDAKKKAGGSAGKQFVPATKKGKVTKSHTKESKEMKISKSKLEQIIREEVERLFEEDFYEVDAIDVNEEYCPVCREAQELEEKKKKKKACKPSKGKRFAKRVNGKCRSYGQAGQKKGGGDRIGKPGSKKANAYCARSAGIKKCKNPPCANTLSRKKWKCRGKKSVA